MKALKWLGLILLILALVLFIISLFLPSHIKLEKEITINAPVNIVFNQVNNYHNWSSWDPWYEKDSTMVIKYSGPDEGVGAKIVWKSEQEGDGYMEIKEVVPNESIKMAIFFSPSNDEHVNLWTFTPAKEGTIAKWLFEFDMGLNPVDKYYFALSGKKNMYEYFERGLNNLKKTAESLPKIPAIEINIKNFPDQKFVTVKEKVATRDMHDFFSKAYANIGEFLGTNQLQPTGPPAAFYHSWNDNMDTFEVEAAMPVDKESAFELTEGISSLELMAGKAVTAIHFGNYNTTGKTWDLLMNYVSENNLEMNGPVYEVYLNDPGMEPDTSKWMTQLVIPVK